MNQKKFYFFLLIIFTATAPTTTGAAMLDSLLGALRNQTTQKTAAPTAPTTSILSNADISSGLKAALKTGAESVVSKLGRQGGFSLDPKIRIPLPATLQKADKALTALGMGQLTKDLETRINTAAEAATPKAKTLFVSAIQKMTLADAKTILSGPDTAATEYLKKSMGPDLAKEMQPVISQALSQAGAVQAYDRVIGQYSQIPFVSGVKDNLNAYVVDKAMAGIFYYIGQEEAAIRQNPAKRTTELLQKVFSSK